MWKGENYCLHWNSLRLRVSLCCKLEIQKYHTGLGATPSSPSSTLQAQTEAAVQDCVQVGLTSETESPRRRFHSCSGPASLSVHLHSNLYWVTISQVSHCVFHCAPPRRKSLSYLAWRWAHLQLLICWLIVVLHGVIPFLMQDFTFIELHDVSLSPFF